MPEPLVHGDVHSHVWAEEHFSPRFRDELARVLGRPGVPAADYETHRAHAAGAARSVVVAFDAPHAGLVVPDEYVAAYVASDPQRLAGFCSIDPRRPDALDRLARAVEQHGLRGVKLAPTYQGYDPLCAEAFALYEAIAERGLPTLWHQGATFLGHAPMAWAMPRLLDEVAIRYPEMPIVVAHLGLPWVDECLALVRKHARVYTDVSMLVSRPSTLRAALISATENGCADRLLFGTDFPVTTIGANVELLRGWSTEPAEPEALRAAARAVLTSRPLEALGL